MEDPWVHDPGQDYPLNDEEDPAEDLHRAAGEFVAQYVCSKCSKPLKSAGDVEDSVPLRTAWRKHLRLREYKRFRLTGA